MIEQKYTQRGGRSPKRVYVARTVEEKQGDLARFLNRLGRRLGRAAAIKTIGSTHLTFLESEGTRRSFRTLSYTPADVRNFSGALQQYLDDAKPRAHLVAKINPGQPLVWMPTAPDKLALNVVQDDELIEERALIESFLQSRFGSTPSMKPFIPHVTVGRVDRRMIPNEARSDPGLLLPEHIIVPQHIALNGLMVYLNNIHNA